MEAFNSLCRLNSCGFEVVNSELITLLPKKPGAREVMDFRLISMIHGMAKWVAKVIANRLAPLLPQIAGTHQSAFVHGHFLHKNFMMVQGTAPSSRRFCLNYTLPRLLTRWIGLFY
jgi:hypothetical protein